MKHAALLALLFAGCKERVAPPALVSQLRDDICKCQDVACVEKVAQYHRDKYGMDFNKTTPENANVMGDIYACVAKLSATATPATPTSELPAVPARLEADALLASVRAWQQQRYRALPISEVVLSYVDANGLLDAEHGQLAVRLGAPRTVDDPNRKTGAPVTADLRPTHCPALTLRAKIWTSEEHSCGDAEPYVAKCSVVEIWKRAIAHGAPRDALATVGFVNDETRSWNVTIEDVPRAVHFSRELPDDCEPVVEKAP